VLAELVLEEEEEDVPPEPEIIFCNSIPMIVQVYKLVPRQYW